MKTICKSLVLTGVLALASTSLYAGDKANCHANKSDCSKACSKQASSCHSGKWSSKHVNLSTTAQRPGYFMTSKGERFCTGKAMKDRENGYTTMTARNNSRDWNTNVESSKNNPARNPS